MRLRCRAHNQHTAERTFGTGFMEGKRHPAATAANRARPVQDEPRHERDIDAGLRSLGFRADEARRAAAQACGNLRGGSLEEKMRLALSYFGKPSQVRSAGAPPPAR